MNIAIDTLAAKSLHHGMGVYIFNLVNRLIRITTEHRFIIYATRINAEYFTNTNNIKKIFITSNRPLRIGWENSLLPFSLLREEVSVFWGPSNFLPVVKFCPYVVTIHDMAAIAFPDYLPTLRRFHYKNSIKNSVRFADRIIAISSQIKNELIQYLNVPEPKIKVIYNGLSDKFLTCANNIPNLVRKIPANLKKKYSLPDSYIFTLGVLEPKKNFANLVRAYARLKTKLTGQDLPKLVIGGSKGFGWQNQEFFQVVKETKLEKEVLFTDKIEHEDLPMIYNSASIFILPSIHEGFGLPVIEAMACGTPVITSNVSCLPEIAGEAAILVNPYQPDEIAEAMAKVLTNQNLRRDMIENGQKNTLRFSWDKAAEDILKLFEDVYRNRSK